MIRVWPYEKDGQMKRTRFTEEQIIGVLNAAHAAALRGGIVCLIFIYNLT
ncbi:hypothetical protein GCM10023219_28890 [Stakelama sediminis]